MLNPLRGEVSITIDGREHILRPSFDAIAKWEEETGMATFHLARSFEDRGAMLKPMAAVVLAASTNGLTKEMLAAEVEKRGFIWLFDPAFLLLVHALNGGSVTEPGEAVAADQAEPAT